MMFLGEPLDAGRVARLPDGQKASLDRIAKDCRTRSIQAGVYLIIAYVFTALALVRWYFGQPGSYVWTLLFVSYVTLVAIKYYRPVRKARTDPILGYLLSVHRHFGSMLPADREEAERKSLWRKKVEDRQAIGRPGFADGEDVRKSCGYQCPECPKDCRLEKDEKWLREQVFKDCPFSCDNCPPRCEGACPTI